MTVNNDIHGDKLPHPPIAAGTGLDYVSCHPCFSGKGSSVSVVKARFNRGRPRGGGGGGGGGESRLPSLLLEKILMQISQFKWLDPSFLELFNPGPPPLKKFLDLPLFNMKLWFLQLGFGDSPTDMEKISHLLC